jgi:hypothetical protein
MRTRNALERLAAVAPAEPLVDSGEEKRMLQRILASDRHVAPRRRMSIAVVLVATVAVGAAVAVYSLHANATSPRGAIHRATLSGAQIEMAGYHFRTPAGFKSSDTSCEGATPTPAGSPETPLHAMQAAASVDGGCVEVLMLTSGNPTAPIPAAVVGEPVDVGSDQGYYDAQGSDVQGDSVAALYVELPPGTGDAPDFLVLYAQGLTEDQLIAVAESGLPGYQ